MEIIGLGESMVGTLAGALASKEGRVKSGSERERVMGRLLQGRTREGGGAQCTKEGGTKTRTV